MLRTIIIIILISLIIFTVGIKKYKKVYDNKYCKQWYLMDKVYEFEIPGKKEWDGFTHENIILNSNIDLGIKEFWEKDYKDELIIAVIDSKVDTNHRDLKEHIWVNKNEIPDNGIDDDNNGYIDDYYGWNFYNGTNQVSSKNEDAIHGTHCTGIIAASHNSIGTMGILGNTHVKIMVLTIFESVNDEIDYNDLVSAIEYASNMGAKVCNISSVCFKGQKEIENAIRDSGMLFVVAAGNFQSELINGLDLEKYSRYPACINLDNVITVSSINEKEKLSLFSNYSPVFVDIVAPGEYIYSTLPNNQYAYESGTSMSTSIVTGILGAYIYSSNSDLERALQLLLDNANQNSDLRKYVSNGKIVYFQKK